MSPKPQHNDRRMYSCFAEVQLCNNNDNLHFDNSVVFSSFTSSGDYFLFIMTRTREANLAGENSSFNVTYV